MRLSTTFIFSALAAFVLPSVAAIHHYPRTGSVTKRAPVSPPRTPALVQRQHHVQRDLLNIDLCVSVDAGVLAAVLNLINPLAAKVHLCLCLHNLDIFLDTDIGVLLAKLLGGKNNLLAVVKLLINTSPNTQQCTFPPHSQRKCVKGNPCAFECDPPYVQVGKQCVCPPPLIECNGKCGSFPNGCGSALPRPKRRAIEPISTFSQAQEFCKAEAVCGIAGREEKTDFECIDTTVALDSCGGCVTPHRFMDVLAPVASGIECGRLPGVVTAACSNSRCVISQCREGWHLDAEKTQCVNSAGGTVKPGHHSRMRKGRKRGIPAAYDVVVAPDLAAKIRAYVGLVIDLTHTSGSIPVPPTAPHTPGSHSPVNHADLVGAIVTAAANLLKSPTVVDLVANANDVVRINHIVQQTLGGCGCVDALGLGPLVARLVLVVESALDIQRWCGLHPVGIPAPYPHPSPLTGPTTPHPPIPNTANAPITIGLDDVLNALGLASKNSRIDVFGLGVGLTGTLNDLLNRLGLGPANVHPRSLLNPRVLTAAAVVLDSDLLTQLHLLVDLVVVLQNNMPTTLPAAPNSPPIIGNPIQPIVPSTVDSGLVDCVVQAVVNLVNSKTVASLIGNVNVLVNVNEGVADLLGRCGCVGSFGLGDLLANLDAVIKVALGIQDWCTHHPVGLPAPQPTGAPLPHPTGTSIPVPHPSASHPHTSVSNPAAPLPSGIPTTPAPPNESNEAIIIGLDQLLTGLLGGLGLGPVKATIVVDGLVGSGLAHSLNNVLNGLGIGPANVIPKGGNPSTGTPIINVDVDATLVAQIRGLVDLVLLLKNGSSALPTAPHSGSPIVPGPGTGPLPIDTTLVDAIVRATINLIDSNTVSNLLLNLDVLVQVNALVNGSLAGCGCIGNLGLEGLVRDIEVLLAAVLKVQDWCAHHPVIPPQPGHGAAPTASLPSPHPSATLVVPVSGHAPAPAPDTDLPIKLGLGDLLASLGLHLNAGVDAVLELNNLLDVIVNIVVNLQGHSAHVPPAIPSGAPHPPTAPSPSGTPSKPSPVHQGLINAVLQAVVNLLHSTTGADVLANVNILLTASGALADALDGCACIDHLGLHALVHDVDELLNTLLAVHVWCQNHPSIGNGDGGASAGGGPVGGAPSSIILNAEQLLGALDLGDILQVDGTVTGPNEGINGLVNPLLKGLGLGGLRRWLAGR